MRKIETIKKCVTVARLRCKRCGAKKTFYLYGFNKTNAYWPSKTWNGWYLKDTEHCPICSSVQSNKNLIKYLIK